MLFNPNFLNYLFSRMGDVFVSYPAAATRNSLPDEISGYRLYKTLRPAKKVNLYYLGIYKDAFGKKYFAKIWSGNRKNTAYFWFKNEIAVYKAINKVIRDNQAEIHRLFKKIKIPQIKIAIEEKHCLILLMEYIEGKPITSIGQNEALDIYAETIKFLDYIDKKIDHNSKTGIFEIGLPYILISSPILAVKALVKNPQLALLIIKSWLVFIIGLPHLLAHRRLQLAHRDLFNNIIVKNKTGYLIDFQITAATLPMTDIAIIFMGYWEKKRSRINWLMESEPLSQIQKDTQMRKLFQLLLIYTGLIDAGIVHVFSTAQIRSYLNYSLNLKLFLPVYGIYHGN